MQGHATARPRRVRPVAGNPVSRQGRGRGAPRHCSRTRPSSHARSQPLRLRELSQSRLPLTTSSVLRAPRLGSLGCRFGRPLAIVARATSPMSGRSCEPAGKRSASSPNLRSDDARVAISKQTDVLIWTADVAGQRAARPTATRLRRPNARRRASAPADGFSRPRTPGSAYACHGAARATARALALQADVPRGGTVPRQQRQRL